MKNLFFAAILACAPIVATAQDATAILGSMHVDPGFRQDLRDRGYTGEHFNVMVEHTRLLFNDAGILKGLENRIRDELNANGYDPNAVFFQRLDYTLVQAHDVGLTLLSAAERQRLFTVDAGFLKAIPARDCTKLMSGRMTGDREGKLFDAYMVKLPASNVRNYLAASRKATRLGLARNARPQTLSAGDVRRAEEAIFPLVDKMIGQQKNARQMYDAWSNGGSPRYACAFSQMFSTAALSLKGGERELAIRYMMTQ